jgi:hypothetical protein
LLFGSAKGDPHVAWRSPQELDKARVAFEEVEKRRAKQVDFFAATPEELLPQLWRHVCTRRVDVDDLGRRCAGSW